MVYFDSDVPINYLVIQDDSRHALAREMYGQAARSGRFFISLLSLQELAFVLARLKIPEHIIVEKIEAFYKEDLANYDLRSFKRAEVIAQAVGFQNINDCLHTAIAETHCTELVTFNKSDFKRIQKYTGLKITVL